MKEIARFLFEVGHLKRVPRSGWYVAGVHSPESVAEHSFRVGWIAYFLAREEGADPARAMMMGLAHDIHEARIGDHHKMAKGYLDVKAIEPRVFGDQVDRLPQKEELIALHDEFLAGETVEAKVALDADRLECAFQGLEYDSEGHPTCRRFYVNAGPRLLTDAGRALYKTLTEQEAKDWYLDAPREP